MPRSARPERGPGTVERLATAGRGGGDEGGDRCEKPDEGPPPHPPRRTEEASVSPPRWLRKREEGGREGEAGEAKVKQKQSCSVKRRGV